MNIDLNAMPTTIDLLHVLLAAIAVVLLILYLTKKGKPTAPAEAEPTPAATPEPPAAEPLKRSNPDAALQLLSLLQQEARFIDFIKEDLTGFSDADIGAAARVVHEGGQRVLNDYFTLAPVRNEDEETRITLAAGFNPSEVRLTGNVVGEPPFTGTLIHRGWKAEAVKLPKLAEEHNTAVIAPAEIEL
jgi:hypothetical protein